MMLSLMIEISPRSCPDRGSLFDHLVGADNERLRKGEAECFRRLEVKNQLEFRWLLDGKIGRLCALQNFVGIAHCAAYGLGESAAAIIVAHDGNVSGAL